MYDFIKTIISAVQEWTKKEIKKNIVPPSTPDWNENDSNADGYIENRTHWEEINLDILVPPTTVTIGTGLFVEEAIDVKLITGQLYYVVWEEKEYQCVCYDYDGTLAIGNNACWDGNNGNGEPFLISNYNGLTAINAYTPGTYTTSVFTSETVIHKLDPKYLSLPDNIATTDDIQIALAPKNFFELLDSKTGYAYRIEIKNGQLISKPKVISFFVNSMPESYVEDGRIDPATIVLIGTAQDGSEYTMSDFTITPEFASSDTTYITITADNMSIDVPITVIPFNPAVELIDFNYTANSDGTYTITGWKQTYKGEYSTEFIVPNNRKIVV